MAQVGDQMLLEINEKTIKCSVVAIIDKISANFYIVKDESGNEHMIAEKNDGFSDEDLMFELSPHLINQSQVGGHV